MSNRPDIRVRMKSPIRWARRVESERTFSCSDGSTTTLKNCWVILNEDGHLIAMFQDWYGMIDKYEVESVDYKQLGETQ